MQDINKSFLLSFDETARALFRSVRLNLPFSDAALAQVRSLKAIRTDDQIMSRRDLRSKNIFTISEHSFDLPECGFSVERTAENFCVGIHVPDLPYAIPLGSPLDEEANTRGCSISAPGGEFPLLPPELTDLMALKQDTSRLCITVWEEFSPDGSLLDCRIERTVVRSVLNGTYADIDALLTDTDTSALFSLYSKYETILHQIRDFYELAAMLRARRLQNGAADFQFLNLTFTLARDGSPRSIGPQKISDSRAMLTELLMQIGEAVGEKLNASHLPAIYTFIGAPVLPERLSATETPFNCASFATEAIRAGKQKESDAFLTRLLPLPQYTTAPQSSPMFALSHPVRFLFPLRRSSDLLALRAIAACSDQSPLPDLHLLALTVTRSEGIALRVQEMIFRKLETSYLTAHPIDEALVLYQTPQGILLLLNGAIPGFLPTDTDNQLTLDKETPAPTVPWSTLRVRFDHNATSGHIFLPAS